VKPEAASCARRGDIAPQGFNEPVRGDHTVGVEQENGKKFSHLGGRQLDGSSVGRDFERPKDPVFHRCAPAALRGAAGDHISPVVPLAKFILFVKKVRTAAV